MFCLYGCSTDKKTDKENIKETIKNYYAKSYDMWMNLDYTDLSNYLDLDSIQSYNKTIALQEAIERWTYSIKKGYYKGKRERHKVFYDYKSININNDEATVDVILSPEKGVCAYPLFICLGENTFNLVKSNNIWLISSHDYSDAYFYERSKTKKIKFDIDKIHREVDRDYK
ncbi:hypothetical protein PV797_17910 [Clostridiaceae bacterium M8S5]|nr:hypothetical protein PV797_17910 [Clostridiaceae bacterium M8S5]